ncbi:MAG: LysM peptidoglycan-binding domain-containing M23 family metallopeptidase [Chloroflexota bacterium]|nr:LysM peptidoglycan-binding domain-containing M23 family metallopeptidase [Chloroflexota bacterium]
MEKKRLFGLVLLLAFVLSGCYKPGPGATSWKAPGSGGVGGGAIDAAPTSTPYFGEVQLTENPLPTPTPNPTVVLPTPRIESLSYTVKLGDTLKVIAQQHQVSVDQIVTLNDITNPDLIEVGQVILIPPPSFEAVAPSFKIIPDSELVNSPSNASFDVKAFVNERNGFLAEYSELVDGSPMTGVQIVERVALEYSVNPRLLLALLEYQSNWVTKSNPPEETQVYPLRYYEAWREGLYKQLAWAANLLNEGYYLWKLNLMTAWILSDNSVFQVNPTINPGTAGVLNVLRYLKTQDNWVGAVSEDGIYETYIHFFGYPFAYTYEPMVPGDLTQPSLQLPFEKGVVWSFTGGPHGGWNSGSAWAAIDFAPPGEALGCFPSEAWVVASAPGEIVYSDHGAVIQDLDGDGIWQTGWSILYMHIATSDRVEVGEYLDAGDRIGHPSCEGGFSTGTHLHIARRYNGEWIAADSDLPLVLDGWVSVGYGVEYDGYLIKGDDTVEAWNGRSPLNAIQR